MHKSKEKTIRILAAAKGKIPHQVLHLAVSSSDPIMRILASREVIDKKSVSGILEMIRHYDTLRPEQHELLAANRDKLALAIRSALTNDDPVTQENAVTAIKELLPYTLISHLLRFIEQGESTAHTGVVSWAITFLTEKFSQEFRGSVPNIPSHGPVLYEITETLRDGFCKWEKHERRVFFDVFFQLSEHWGAPKEWVHEILLNAKHPAHFALMGNLMHSLEPSALRFVVRYLEERPAPPSLLSLVSKRTDKAFLNMLFRSIGHQPPILLRENLNKIHSFVWLSSIRSFLERLEEHEQRFVVELVNYSGLYEHEKMMAFEQIMRFGKPESRAMVIERLHSVTTNEADRLVLTAVDDVDPKVQTVALMQIRHRKIRNATAKLLGFIDSPHENIRKAVVEQLPEFRMCQFLKVRGSLNEEQQQYMLSIVKKVDGDLHKTINHELGNPQQKQKDFLLDFITQEKIVRQFEDALLPLAEKENDFFVRMKAIKLLAFCIQPASYQLLKEIIEHDQNTEICILAKRIREIRDVVANRRR